jgi:hypothetical protein
VRIALGQEDLKSFCLHMSILFINEMQSCRWTRFQPVVFKQLSHVQHSNIWEEKYLISRSIIEIWIKYLIFNM